MADKKESIAKYKQEIQQVRSSMLKEGEQREYALTPAIAV